MATRSAPAPHPADEGLSLWDGGLLDGVERRLRVRGAGRDEPARVVVYLGVGWFGFLVVCALEAAVTGHWSPLLRDFAVHTRWLVGVPLLVWAERATGRRVSESSAFLVRANVIPEDRGRAHRTYLAKIRGLLCSTVVEGLLIAAAVIVGIAAARRGAHDAASLYYQLASLSLFRFLYFRWLFRWLLWGVLLWHVSRQPLHLVGSHPDRLGGLGVLELPSRTAGLIVLATSIVLASEWGSQMYHQGLTVNEFLTPMFAFAGLAVLFTIAPLLPLIGPVVESRVRASYDLTLLARKHGSSFKRRWIDEGTEDPVGSPDMSSMADLGSVTQTVVSLPVLPFPRILVIEILAAALVPMAPLYLTGASVDQLVEHLIKNLVGV